MKTNKKSSLESKVTEAKHKNNLQDIALFISGHARTAMLSKIIMWAADLFFAKMKEAFTQNPANTAPYRALHASENEAIIQIAGILKDENHLFPILGTIRRKGDLISHRDVIGHPNVVAWRKPANQQFVDEDRQWRDLKAALVWDMQRSVNELLTEVGGKIYIDEFAPSYEYAAMLHLILELSMKVPVSLDIAELQKCLVEGFYPKYREFLEKHPDGRLPDSKDRTMKDLIAALKVDMDADKPQTTSRATTS